MNTPFTLPKRTTTLALALASTLCFSGTGLASPITYTSQYLADTLPPTSDGTIPNPSWVEIMSAGSEVSANGGVLSASTVHAQDSNQLFWLLGQHDDGSDYGTYQAWSIDPSVGFTVDFRIQILEQTGSSETQAGGFMIQVSDGNRVGSFYFGTDAIYYNGASDYKTSIPLNLTTGFTTFRIVGQNSSYSLYMEGMDTPLFENLLGGWLPNYNRILWGDFSLSLSGAYNLDFLGWNNQMAEFSAPVSIPEPSVAMLLMGGLGAGLAVRLRSR